MGERIKGEERLARYGVHGLTLASSYGAEGASEREANVSGFSIPGGEGKRGPVRWGGRNERRQQLYDALQGKQPAKYVKSSTAGRCFP